MTKGPKCGVTGYPTARNGQLDEPGEPGSTEWQGIACLLSATGRQGFPCGDYASRCRSEVHRQRTDLGRNFHEQVMMGKPCVWGCFKKFYKPSTWPWVSAHLEEELVLPIFVPLDQNVFWKHHRHPWWKALLQNCFELEIYFFTEVKCLPPLVSIWERVGFKV